MVIRRKSLTTSFKTQLGLCLLAGTAAGVLVAIVVPNTTRPVQADARVPGPVANGAPISQVTTVSPVVAPTPAMAQVQKPAKKTRTDILRGIASWYGKVLNGHRTASGERFDMYAMTACHPTLPFGTMVRVMNLNTKKSVVVRINDRGELSEGRIIDLSYAAAEELDITRAGLAPVALDVISLGKGRGKK